MSEKISNIDRICGFLGLCKRAGKVITGQESCVELARSGQAALILADESVSENTSKRIRNTCETHNVPYFFLPDGRLGQAIGQPNRMIAAMKSDQMAQKLLHLLQESTITNL